MEKTKVAEDLDETRRYREAVAAQFDSEDFSDRRFPGWAAIALLPFLYPKLAVTANIDADGWGAQLEAARERTAKLIELRAAPTVLAGGEPADGGVADPERARDVG